MLGMAKDISAHPGLVYERRASLKGSDDISTLWPVLEPFGQNMRREKAKMYPMAVPIWLCQ